MCEERMGEIEGGEERKNQLPHSQMDINL